MTTGVDAGSVAVPGVFAALELASERFGALPWRHLMDVVAAVVEPGFPLSEPSHHYLNEGAAPIYLSDPVARAALFEGEQSKPLGSLIRFPDLADTLRHIGEMGAGTLYLGDLSQAIVSDLAERGGQLTREDLAGYEAVVREPLAAEIGSWRLSLNPQPAVGGFTVSRVLDQLTPDSSEEARAKALIGAFEERLAKGLRSPSTISVAAADDDGGVVAGSFSAGYGSGIIPEGTGMLMNNAVGELELAEGDGVPGERMVSNMAPTIARRGADAVAVGSPGADRITTAIATTLVRLARGDALIEAIDHPRAHPEFGDWGVRLATEPGIELSGVGVPLRELPGRHMYFGGVNGAGFQDGVLVAHADPRRTGSVGFTTP